MIDLAALSGMREAVIANVQQAVRTLMVDALTDQLLHAEIVAAGRDHFRAAFAKDMAGFFHHNQAGCDDLANVVHRFLVGQWQHKYPAYSAVEFLDTVEIKAPPTEQEIDDAWELEIGSSEAALEKMYEGSARIRKGRDLGAKH